MPHGLDHLVHVVADLRQAAATYARMGFQIGVENRHPFGTANRLVQVPGFFVELLAVEEPEKIPEPAPGKFSFAAFNRDFLARNGEGASMLVLESHDAEADRLRFERALIGGFERLDFSRGGKTAADEDVELSFRVAFAGSAAMPDVGFFTCEQRHPAEHFWDAALQRHPNAVTGVAGAVFTAENPTDHHIFFSAFTGLRDFVSNSTGLRFSSPRGEVEVITPVAFESRYGSAPPPGVRLSALRWISGEPPRTVAMLDAGAIAFEERHDWIVVPAEAAHGLVLAFEAEG
jgi:hypothetical protein